MEWSKLKTIILILLVGVNLTLLGMVATQYLRDRSDWVQTRRDALSYLRLEGIQLEEDILPRANALSPMGAERSVQEEEQMARTLLGEGLSLQDRGGGVYLYQSRAGEIQFHSDGSLRARLDPAQFPLEGMDPQDHALAWMDKLSFQGQVMEAERGPEGCTLVLGQQWQGTPLCNLQMTLEYDTEGLTAISAGRRLFGTPAAQEGEVLSVPSALVHFVTGLSALGDVCSTITDIVPGYVGSSSLRDGMLLTPVWYISTDTGIYQLDLMDGGLGRV